MENLKNNKVFKITKIVVKTLILIALFAFIIAVCLQRFSDNKLSIFNYRMFTVVSGSMAPTYNIGDVLISKEMEPKKIRVGQTVSYKGNSGSFDGMIITHEVVGVEKGNDDKYYFHTRGKANLVEDPIVSEDQLYGVVVYKTVILSFFYRLISTSFGFYMLIIIPLITIVGYEIIMTLLEKEAERREKKKAN